MKIKVCGMKFEGNISELIEVGIDYMGFIFYPRSPRFVGDDFDPAILRNIPDSIAKVGVFVNEPFDSLTEKVKTFQFGYVQLHGNESPEFCKKVEESGTKVIKAFRVIDDVTDEELEPFQKVCSYFLFDTKTKGYGGSGKQFDWYLLNHLKINKPFFLSGGIGPNDIVHLKKFHHDYLHAIDINSKFETTPGYKNIMYLRSFVHQLKQTINE